MTAYEESLPKHDWEGKNDDESETCRMLTSMIIGNFDILLEQVTVETKYMDLNSIHKLETPEWVLPAFFLH